MFPVALARPAADIDRSEDVLLLHDQAEPDGPPALVKPMGPPSELKSNRSAAPATTSTVRSATTPAAEAPR
jgi:rod shape-determining protein MreC